MKNIQWRSILGVVTAVSVLFICSYLYFNYQVEGQGFGGAFQYGIILLFYVIPFLFILAELTILTLAKERKGLHAFLVFLFLLLIGALLGYVRVLIQ